MQSITECYKKVSKDCFKFIRSQETTKEKFKSKEKMIKSFLIPISFWINNRTNKSKPYLIGLAGVISLHFSRQILERMAPSL